MKIEPSIITRVQHANDIIDVVSEHVNLTRKGKEMVGLCPFHDDHKPSLYVNPDKQIFKCFACGAGGDVIKFVQMRENLSFAQAVERLAKRAGIKISFSKQTPAAQSEVSPDDIEKVNRWAAQHWRNNLLDKQLGNVCRNYLLQRKITEKSSAEFYLGYAPDRWDDLLSAARQKRIPDQLLLAAGLIVKGEGGYYDKFRNRLMFPILDASQKFIGFGGRTLGDDPAKYMNSPNTILFDKSNCVYGLDKARQYISGKTVVLVEGYTDVIMAHQAGCKNVVATLGTSLTTGHTRLLRRYAKEMVLVFDSDAAGIAAAERAMEICLSEKIDIRITSVPAGKDPCDFILAAGGKEFEQLIKNAVDIFEYSWGKLSQKLASSNNLVDKRQTIEAFLQKIGAALAGGTVDIITHGLIINKLSRILQIPPADIRKQISRWHIPAQKTITVIDNQKVSKVELGSFGRKAQEEIIEVILNEPRLFESAAKRIKTEDFDEPILKESWQIIANTLTGNMEFSLINLLAQTESEEVSNLLVRLSDNGQDLDTLKRRLDGAVKALKEYNDRKSEVVVSDDDRLKQLLSVRRQCSRRNPGLM